MCQKRCRGFESFALRHISQAIETNALKKQAMTTNAMLLFFEKWKKPHAGAVPNSLIIGIPLGIISRIYGTNFCRRIQRRAGHQEL
jgi:hypothetical protein